MLTVAPGCELEGRRGPDWLLGRVRHWDAAEPSELVERLWRLMQQHFTYRLVLELDGVRAMDSGLIEQLAQLHRRIEKHDGVMRLCGVSPQNRQALLERQWDDRLPPYYGDVEEAVMGRPHPQRPR